LICASADRGRERKERGAPSALLKRWSGGWYLEEDVCKSGAVKEKKDDSQDEVVEPKNLKPEASGLFGEGMDR
jgi:hypothetical protein